MPRLGLRHVALQFPVAGKNRFLQFDRFRIEAPRFFERLVDARHYRLGPTSRSGPRVGRVERAGVVLIYGPLAWRVFPCQFGEAGVPPPIVDPVFHLKNRLPERLNPPIEPRDPLLELLNMAVPLLDHRLIVLLHPLGLLMNKRFRLPRQLSECLRPKMNIGLAAQLGRSLQVAGSLRRIAPLG